MTFLMTLLMMLSAGRQKTDQAHELLEKLAARHRSIQRFTADFVQEVRTPLVTRPLVSKGTLSFRRSPACAVFQVRAPAISIVRFDEKSYQVYRPEEERAERYLFSRDDLGSALVKVFAPRTEDMEKVFRISSSREQIGSVTIDLEPIRKDVSSYFRSLALVVSVDGPTIQRVVYRNTDGDEVCIELSNMRYDPPLDDALFDPELPKGTKLEVHRVHDR